MSTNLSNVGECKKEVDFMSNEMSVDGGLGVDLQEMCISRKASKKKMPPRLQFVLLLREGDTKKTLDFLECPKTRATIQLGIDSMRSNGFGNVEEYYQKLKKRVTEYGY